MRKLDLTVAIILGLLVAALASRTAALAWMALPFLFYLAGGLWNAPGEPRLRAARSVPQARCGSGAATAVTLTVVNESENLPLLRIATQVIPGMEVIEGQGEPCFSLPAGGIAESRLAVRLSRGLHEWQDVTAAASDLFGLFEQPVTLPAPARVRVLPDPLPISRMSLLPLTTLQAVGPNLSRLPGPGVNFWGVRAYQPGDSLRRVHWRLSSHRPGQYFSKEFEREQMADVGLILDGSTAPESNGAADLFEHSVQAAAGLARFLLRRGDRVSLFVLGERIERVYPGSGKGQLARILDTLAAARPGSLVPFSTLKHLPAQMFPARSLIILISPLQERDIPAVTRLRAEGYPVLLVCPRAPQPEGLDTPGLLARRAQRVESLLLLWRAQQLGVQVVDWPVDRPLTGLTAGLVRRRP